MLDKDLLKSPEFYAAVARSLSNNDDYDSPFDKLREHVEASTG